MKVEIQTFGKLKDYFDDSFELEIPEESTVQETVEALKKIHTEAGDLLNHCRYALDEEIVDAQFRLHAGAVVCLFPPSSGG